MFQRKDDENTARTLAWETRRKLFGMSIENRIISDRYMVHPVVMPKNAIEPVEVDGTNVLVRVAYEDKHFVAVVGNATETRRAIEELVRGEIKERPDTECVNLDLPPLQEILDRLAAGEIESLVSTGTLRAIFGHIIYFDFFRRQLAKQGRAKRRAIEAAIVTGPAEFAEAYKEILPSIRW